MIKSQHLFSPQEYIEAVFGECYIFNKENTLEEIECIIDDYGESDNLWSYCLEDSDEAIREHDVVLVDVSGFYDGKWEENYRWFEVYEDFFDKQQNKKEK